MEVECIVVAGEWSYSQDGRWDFDIDSRRMSRLVHFVESVPLSDLCDRLFLEFGESCDAHNISVSYFTPDLPTLGIGKQTPPVIISTDATLRTFCRHYLASTVNNLYVSFICKEIESSFVTPCNVRKRKIDFSSGGSSGGNIDVCYVNEQWLEEVESIEEAMRSSGKARVLSPRWSLGLEEDAISESSGDSIDVEEMDVRPRGYDKEFWEPFLEDTYGGSNAVDLLFMSSDPADRDVPLVPRNLSDEYGLLQDVPISQLHGEDVLESSTRVVRSAPVKGQFGGQKAKANTLSSGQQPGPSLSTIGQRGNSHKATTNAQKSNEIAADTLDIPPMYDDTRYVTSLIPDLDVDEGDESIEVGKTYVSKDECQTALAIYAIRNMFHFKQSRTTKDYFVVTCSDQRCGWRVYARKMKDNAYYQIRKVRLEHTCSIETRSKFSKKVSAKVIAHVFKSKYGDLDSGPKTKELQKLVLEELRVPTSYSKCWRANQLGNEGVRGTEEECYLKVEEYLHMLKNANPGTITDLKTEPDEEGGERFLYLFLAFGASIEGFRFMRRIIVLDGTHLSGKYKGVLLTASAQDANFQVFPLAFAVVDSEKDDSWTWFLSKLKLITGDGPDLAVISDRHQSILKAVKTVYPLAKHGGCIVHLARNVHSHFKNKGLAQLVMKAACAYRVKHFREVFAEIQGRNPNCGKYLEKIGFPHWTRAHFPIQANRYNVMTSNIAEALNNALKTARRATITELISVIQSMLIRWFSARRKISAEHRGYLTPEVDKIITRNLAASRGSKVASVSTWSCEVVGVYGERHYVQLSERRCTCRGYDTLQIPCGHALIAANSKGLCYGPLAGEHYSTAVWARSYEGLVKPNEDPGDCDIPEEISRRCIKPPRARRPCGRPKVNRILSTGEFPVDKNQNKCGRCGEIGHNKKTCKNPI